MEKHVKKLMIVGAALVVADMTLGYSTGNRNCAREPEDAGLALFGNIKVWTDPMGMMISIR